MSSREVKRLERYLGAFYMWPYDLSCKRSILVPVLLHQTNFMRLPGKKLLHLWSYTIDTYLGRYVLKCPQLCPESLNEAFNKDTLPFVGAAPLLITSHTQLHY